MIYVFGTRTHAHERKRRIFVVVVIWNLPLKQRCCCCFFLFISKILFCYYVVGISLYFYNSFLFYFAYILLHSARHYDLNRLVKIQIICMLVATFLTFSLRFLLLITHIVSVFQSKTHRHTRREILQIGHGSTNSTSGAQFFNIFRFFHCVCDFKAARLHHFSFPFVFSPFVYVSCFFILNLISVRILAFLQIARVILFVASFIYSYLTFFLFLKRVCLCEFVITSKKCDSF